MAMGLPIVAIGMIGLVGATASNVIDRTREIGILRSIGARRRDLRAMFRMEGLVIAALGIFAPVGIMLALNYAGDRANVQSPDMLYQVTERLGVAFSTTLLALVMASILVFIQNVVQGKEETALNKAGQYCLDNLINRLYSP